MDDKLDIISEAEIALLHKKEMEWMSIIVPPIEEYNDIINFFLFEYPKDGMIKAQEAVRLLKILLNRRDIVARFIRFCAQEGEKFKSMEKNFEGLMQQMQEKGIIKSDTQT